MAPNLDPPRTLATRRSAFALTLLALLLCLPGPVLAQKNPIKKIKDDPKGLRESTLRIVADHQLDKTIKQNPAAAIRELDRLRTDGSEPADDIALAIAEVAIKGGSRKN